MHNTRYYFQAVTNRDQFLDGECQQFVQGEYLQAQKTYSLGIPSINIEKIASVMLIVSFLVLAAKIITETPSNVKFTDSSKGKQQIGRGRNGLSTGLGQVQRDLIDEQQVFHSSYRENVRSRKKQDSPSTRSLSTISMANPLKPGQGRHQLDGIETSSSEETTVQLSHLPSSILLGQTDLDNSLKQVRQQRQREYSVSYYARFAQIYSDMDGNLHRSVHSLSKEEREDAVSRYFKGKSQQNEYFEDLLKQNDQLQTSRTKKDALYLELLREDYQFYPTQQQNFICVVLSAHNNAFNGQIRRTLNSIFSQQYQNYQLVIADSSSSDSTISQVNSYLLQHNKTAQAKIIQFQSSSAPFSALSAMEHCQEGSFVLILDGNTELIGKQVFNIIDSEQKQSKAALIYSDYYALDVDTSLFCLSKSYRYEDAQKFMLLYRTLSKDYGKILAARLQTFKSIPMEYVKFNEQQFEYSGLNSIAYSLMELSCGRVRVVEEPLALKIYDSSLEREEEGLRAREQAAIATKAKLDVC